MLFNCQQMKHFPWISGLIAIMTSILGSNSAIASEAVVCQSKIGRKSISVEEIKQFSETGKLSSSLEFYLKKSQGKPEQLKRALTTPVPIDSVFLYDFLNRVPGELVLDQMSTIIKNPSGKANRESLRAAVVSSALPDNNIRLIEVMENYPTKKVLIECDRVLEVHKNVSKIIEKFPIKSSQ